ncbi:MULTISPECIES: SDR family oxidoreductase [unclassified Microbacterium]|uniref:SDR family oxidoreductase n=1 Tax=unclassified Microbacterium TaxID=2609290 RepID=UPI000CFA96A7|nr:MULTISPECIES: SDR family oxidoreductase [unclassified Microbacterium]PQZ60582.1 NAD-dependent dehydratase [Microbacterium sp. MYb43]PQZ82008.1 NAD-dependent dehydratase [Microbacterium sp. MYb40]PRB22271.1 NAD-dependent dehydratase [Microbacterium sp. MYb54]PRB31164.1 NAD-dependent dehydratase [Microbacterium sp. MYb50]PRB69773.1 NAD-dependent dehydratase [Microbacterium sp. MYb24]
MSRIIVFGGHGRIALLLAPLLVARGDEVTGVIRNPDHAAEVEAGGATALVADVENMDVEAIAEIISGHDAVVWSAGAGGGSAERTYAVDRDAAQRSMNAAERAGVRRYVMVSWLGSTADHGVPEGDSFFPYADAKWAADEHLRGTGLEGTILAPGTLTFDDPTSRIQIDPAGRGAVSRADVATVIAVSLHEPCTIGRTIRFGNGDAESAVPIAEALAC